MVPFVMDSTNHRAPTHYGTDLGQTFAYSAALKTLLGAGLLEGTNHSLLLLPTKRGRARRRPRGHHLVQEILCCSKMTHK